VAEQVEKVDPELVTRDDQGKPYSVRYEAVNAMLLNEFLKEHRKVDEQTKEIGRLKSDLAEQRKDFEDRIAQQQKQIAALATGLQKVSGRLESSGSSACVMASN
jgi:septal ring factor EnvC (AmiA/AmiB activator)